MLALGCCLITPALADPKGMLETIRKHKFLASTIPENGDVNPYAVVVAPVSAGVIQKDDVLVDNFNNISNLQGTGTTIILYRPSTKETRLFAQVPQRLKDCPGGVGLSTAMTMLRQGWVIVGSTPSTDGTTRTKGDGCLLVFDAEGHHVATWVSPTINDPWGNIAAIDRGDSATLFISMAGKGLKAPDVVDPVTRYPVIEHEATVLRLELTIPPGKPPVLQSQTVIGDGFANRADRDNFLLGPTGLALGADDTLYVTDGLDNEITAIPEASTRTTSAGKGRLVTKDGLLSWPLAMVMTPQGHLLVNNGKNGQIVEIDPSTGQQIYAHWLNTNQAQSPPGNGNLFGLALTADGKGFYYVEDDINSLRISTP
ncbi:MAG: hypothetical protein JSR19_10650 [Proteobacteria bacterium]|nr:hypothetical protein [Pseudomonadota bacterium]